MILIKNKSAFEKMRIAGRLLSSIMHESEQYINIGVSTLYIDSKIEILLKQNGLKSCTKGFMGYRHSSCISLNDEVVHGVPSEKKIICDNDLIKIDLCASFDGYCADMARCFYIGKKINNDVTSIIDVAYKALDSGIRAVKVGSHLSDISFAIQEASKSYGIVRDFAGHGIGKKMHEEPEILNYGLPGKGPIIRVGMAFAIEPMLTLGKHDVFIEKDGWTVRTSDGSLAVHVEDTVIVTDKGIEIITRSL